MGTDERDEANQMCALATYEMKSRKVNRQMYLFNIFPIITTCASSITDKITISYHINNLINIQPVYV